MKKRLTDSATLFSQRLFIYLFIYLSIYLSIAPPGFQPSRPREGFFFSQTTNFALRLAAPLNCISLPHSHLIRRPTSPRTSHLRRGRGSTLPLFSSKLPMIGRIGACDSCIRDTPTIIKWSTLRLLSVSSPERSPRPGTLAALT